MSGERDAVVGAGIVGLALARALARRGHRVTLFDAGPAAEGASLRNFGTLWPIGQPAGSRRALALASLAIWREVLAEAGAWSVSCGSLHLAYHEDELRVLEEFAAVARAADFVCRLLTPTETGSRWSHIRRERLLGSLWSPHEAQVNPRQLSSRCAGRSCSIGRSILKWAPESRRAGAERCGAATALGRSIVCGWQRATTCRPSTLIISPRSACDAASCR